MTILPVAPNVLSAPAVFCYHFSGLVRVFKMSQSSPICPGWGVCCHIYIMGAHYRTPVDYHNMSLYYLFNKKRVSPCSPPRTPGIVKMKLTVQSGMYQTGLNKVMENHKYVTTKRASYTDENSQQALTVVRCRNILPMCQMVSLNSWLLFKISNCLLVTISGIYECDFCCEFFNFSLWHSWWDHQWQW